MLPYTILLLSYLLRDLFICSVLTESQDKHRDTEPSILFSELNGKTRAWVGRGSLDGHFSQKTPGSMMSSCLLSHLAWLGEAGCTSPSSVKESVVGRQLKTCTGRSCSIQLVPLHTHCHIIYFQRTFCKICLLRNLRDQSLGPRVCRLFL